MSSTKPTSKTKTNHREPEGPQSKGWKDADYNEGGGLKDVGGRGPTSASEKKARPRNIRS